MNDKLLYFHFDIGNKEVWLRVAGPDGVVLEEINSPLNFEDNLFSALAVLHRLMTAREGRRGYQPNREFIRKIGNIQASLLNMTTPDPAAAVDVQKLFEKYWKTLAGDAAARACFSFSFAAQAPYTELSELPWEFLAYQNLDLAINNSPACDFIRCIALPAPPAMPPAVRQNEPLQVLLILSEPDPEALRQAGPSLVPYRESYLYRLLRLYQNMADTWGNRLRLRVLFQPRPAEIQHAQLARKAVPFDEFLAWFQKNMVEPDSQPIRNNNAQDVEPHIVHFVGHVGADERDEEVVGCINDENGLAYVAYPSFSGCFAAAPPAVFILQSPEGVQLHRGAHTQSGLLADLAQKKMPYLLSFQHPVSEQGSLAFLRELYSQLFDAQSVPAAVSSARLKLNLGAYPDANAYGSPTLYTTLPANGILHRSLVSKLRPEDDAVDAAAVEKMSLTEKIDWYGQEIRRFVEAAEYEIALEKFREIVNIAVRSPQSDVALAQQYQNEMSTLIGRFNTDKKAYQNGDINYDERERRHRSVGSTLLDYFSSGGFPRVARKSAEADRNPVTTLKTAAKNLR